MVYEPANVGPVTDCFPGDVALGLLVAGVVMASCTASTKVRPASSVTLKVSTHDAPVTNGIGSWSRWTGWAGVRGRSRNAPETTAPPTPSTATNVAAVAARRARRTRTPYRCAPSTRFSGSTDRG